MPKNTVGVLEKRATRALLTARLALRRNHPEDYRHVEHLKLTAGVPEHLSGDTLWLNGDTLHFNPDKILRMDMDFLVQSWRELGMDRLRARQLVLS